MLYPYSDNYLDDPAITQTDKLTFNERFRQRLCGQRIAAVNTHETSIWSMVQMIEEQYPRQRYPQVYESLLAIHRSQGESIAQLNHGAGINHSSNLDEVLRISCAKGGSSVLADACIAQPWLTPEESRFSFEWGVLLQLGDDLQDVREDLERGSLTLFTRAVQQGIPLDSLVRQLLHFSDRVANRMDNLANGTDALKDLLRMSWRTLILMAVADAQQFCSREFLAELEPCSLFHFDFLRARNKKLVGREALFATLFDAFVKAGEVETGQDDQAGVSLPDGIRKAIPIPAVFADRGQFAHPLPAFSSLTA
jgi:lambda repressor-like predicted transcriptional regulator